MSTKKVKMPELEQSTKNTEIHTNNTETQGKFNMLDFISRLEEYYKEITDSEKIALEHGFNFNLSDWVISVANPSNKETQFTVNYSEREKNDNPLLNEDDAPRREVKEFRVIPLHVICPANQRAKFPRVLYNQYSPNGDNSPVCFSADGVTGYVKAENGERKQRDCNTCRHQTSQSAKLPNGEKLKLCGHVKRVVGLNLDMPESPLFVQKISESWGVIQDYSDILAWFVKRGLNINHHILTHKVVKEELRNRKFFRLKPSREQSFIELGLPDEELEALYEIVNKYKELTQPFFDSIVNRYKVPFSDEDTESTTSVENSNSVETTPF